MGRFRNLMRNTPRPDPFLLRRTPTPVLATGTGQPTAVRDATLPTGGGLQLLPKDAQHPAGATAAGTPAVLPPRQGTRPLGQEQLRPQQRPLRLPMHQTQRARGQLHLVKRPLIGAEQPLIFPTPAVIP